MPRAMSTAMLAAIQATSLQPGIFVQIAFRSTTAYLWSGVGSIVWNGETWSGMGSLLSFAAVEEGATVMARGVTIVLSGLDAALLTDCNSDFELGLPVIIYFGLFSAGSLIADPIETWAGRTDQPTVEVTGTEATISINCESRLLDMNVPADRRYTNEDQQMDHPGDLGFQFVNAIQEITIFWGQQAHSTNNI
jgi:hypothetical protein